MEQLHLVLGWVAVAGAIGLLVAAVVTTAATSRSYLLLDRAILGQVATFALAIASGLAVLPAHGGPADPLHFVYAVVGIAVAPSVRYATRHSDARRMARWQVVAAAIALGVVVRLFMTGA